MVKFEPVIIDGNYRVVLGVSKDDGSLDFKPSALLMDRFIEKLFDPEGVPQSEEMRLVERFTPNADYTRLDYRIAVTDPVYFTEPFELSRYFVWKPEMSVQAYDCLERDWN